MDPHHILQCDDLALQLWLHSAGPFNTRNILNLCWHSCIAIYIYMRYMEHYQNVRAAHQLLASHCTKYICTAIWIKFSLSSRLASTIYIFQKKKQLCGPLGRLVCSLATFLIVFMARIQSNIQHTTITTTPYIIFIHNETASNNVMLSMWWP